MPGRQRRLRRTGERRESASDANVSGMGDTIAVDDRGESRNFPSRAPLLSHAAHLLGTAARAPSPLPKTELSRASTPERVIRHLLR